MSIHTFMDGLGATAGRKYPKYFRDGLDSASLAEHLAAVQIPDQSLTGDGSHPVEVATLAGRLDAVVTVRRSARVGDPVIIYHHGAKESDTSFNGIFGKRHNLNAHVVLVRAPFHGSFSQFLQGIATLNSYLAMYAVSARLIEEVITQFRSIGAGRITVTGTSLGGFVSIAHHNYYNTADTYLPLLAGPNLAHCLLESAYSAMTSDQAKQQLTEVGKRLDLAGEYTQRPTDNVHPLLGRHDRIVVAAANLPAYGNTVIEYMDRGHFTGSVAFALLRRHILKYALAV